MARHHNAAGGIGVGVSNNAMQFSQAPTRRKKAAPAAAPAEPPKPDAPH